MELWELLDVGCIYSVTELELVEIVDSEEKVLWLLVEKVLWLLAVDPLLTEVSDDVQYVVDVCVVEALDIVDSLV